MFGQRLPKLRTLSCEPTCVSRPDPGLCYCLGNSQCQNCRERHPRYDDKDARIRQLETEVRRLRTGDPSSVVQRAGRMMDLLGAGIED